MIDVSRFNAALSGYCRELGRDATNYTVSAVLYETSGVAARSVADTVKAAIGSSVETTESTPTVAESILKEVEECFTYAGGHGAQPSPGFIGSEAQMSALTQILNEVASLCDGAESLTRICIEEGHPFYPVFWDYAFVIERTPQAYVLVASSSD